MLEREAEASRRRASRGDRALARRVRFQASEARSDRRERALSLYSGPRALAIPHSIQLRRRAPQCTMSEQNRSVGIAKIANLELPFQRCAMTCMDCVKRGMCTCRAVLQGCGVGCPGVDRAAPRPLTTSALALSRTDNSTPLPT